MNKIFFESAKEGEDKNLKRFHQSKMNYVKINEICYNDGIADL